MKWKISVDSLNQKRREVKTAVCQEGSDYLENEVESGSRENEFLWVQQGFILRGFVGGSVVKSPPANAGDPGSIPRQRRSPGGGHANPLQCPLQCSCLENPTDRGAWRATVHGITRSRTRLSRHAYAYLEEQICLHVLLRKHTDFGIQGLTFPLGLYSYFILIK